VSAAVPAARPLGAVRCSVAVNGCPATLKNRLNVRYSSVPSGRPPGSWIVAPYRIALSLPASGLAVPSGFVFGWNGTFAQVCPKREHAGLAEPWNIVRLWVG
jgi:hypothetical protein